MEALQEFFFNPGVIFILILLVATILMTTLSFFYVRPDEYAKIEWSFPLSPTVENGHFIATGWQQGTWATVYGPGWHFIFLIHLFGYIRYKKTTEVPAGQLGKVFAKDGRALPVGQIIAPEDVECDDFTDGEKFLLNGGWQGYQLRLRPPGKVIMNEDLFELTFIEPPVISTFEEQVKNPATGETQTRIRAEIGIVTALIGEEIPEDQRGQIIAKAPVFPKRKGEEEFEEEEGPAGHSNFQDAVAFLEAGGQAGIQEEIVGPMRWGGNPVAFKLDIVPAPFVPPGSVGVLISNVGDEPTDEEKEFVGVDKTGKSVFIVKKGISKKLRGILPETKGPGDHFIHPVAYRLFNWDVTPRSVILDGSPEEFEKVSVVTSDGFTVPMQAELIYHIPPVDAPKAFALARSNDELDEDILAPFVDDISKRIGAGKAILSLFKERENFRKEIEGALKEALEKDFPVKVTTFRIKQFDFEASPDAEVRTFANLLARQANATQEEITVAAETQVAIKRIELEKQKGIASGTYIQEVGKELVKVAKKLPDSMTAQLVGMLGVSPGNLSAALANFLNNLAEKNK